MKKYQLQDKQTITLGGSVDVDNVVQFFEDEFPHGIVTPKEVLNKARNKRSPVHKYFDWDDSSAAEKYRLDQARALIRCLIIVDDDDDDGHRKYTAPLVLETGERAYVDIDKVVSNEFLWKQLIAIALKDLQLWKKRYEHLKELKPVFVVADKLERKYSEKSSK